MNRKVLIVLIGVIIFAAALRLWNIGKVPISPDWDEVSLGYNAYSILHTGRDEYGKILPVVLKSFGDYKPALYAYLIIPFILIFDLSIVAVRVPSAIFGVLSVIALYFLVKELFEREDFALGAAFLLAISPWHIQFSRVGFESNVGLALNIFAILFFIKGLKRPTLLSLSSFFAALSLYVYQSEKVFVPLLLISLLIIYRKQIFSAKKNYLIGFFVVGLITIIPLIVFTLSNPGSLSRATSTSVFSQSQIIQKTSKRLEKDKANHDTIGLLFDNRRVVYGKEIISGYLSHFDPNWLFLAGDNPRHHAPGMGLLYLIELPFLLIGIFALLFYKSKKNLNTSKWVVFAFLFLAPIPASITQDVPHAVRTLNMLPFFLIAVSFGIITSCFWVVKHIKIYPIRYAIFGVVIGLFVFNFLYYLNQYFIQQNYFTAKDWQYGYAQTVADVSKIKEKYSKVIVSNVTPMDQSYMFFLFYLKYPPQNYQQLTQNDSTDKKTFGNFEFRTVDWNTDRHLNNTLLIGTLQDFPGDVKTVDKINYPDGKTAIKFVETGK